MLPKGVACLNATSQAVIPVVSQDHIRHVRTRTDYPKGSIVKRDQLVVHIELASTSGGHGYATNIGPAPDHRWPYECNLLQLHDAGVHCQGDRAAAEPVAPIRIAQHLPDKVDDR